MRSPDVTMETFQKMAVALGHNVDDFDLDLVTILMDAMNRSYNMGYDEGFKDGMEIMGVTSNNYAKTGRVEME